MFVMAVAMSMAAVNGQMASCWPSGLVTQSDMPFCRLMDQNFALHWSIHHMTLTMGIYVLGANKARLKSHLHLPRISHISAYLSRSLSALASQKEASLEQTSGW
jgi:hypothetical protein